MRRIAPIFVLALGACSGLLSKTEFLRFDLVNDGQPASPGADVQIAAGATFEFEVDMSLVDTWAEHKDEIEAIDRAGFDGDVDPSSPLYFSVYLGMQGGLSDPAAEGVLLLDSFQLTRTARRLSLRDTEREMLAAEELADAVRDGHFWLYFVNEGDGDLTMTDLELVIGATLDL